MNEAFLVPFILFIIALGFIFSAKTAAIVYAVMYLIHIAVEIYNS